MYLLDTNIISYWMRGDRGVIARLKEHAPAELSLSAVTLAEIYYGIERSPVKKEERWMKINRISSLLDLFYFDKAAARIYARIRARLEKEGTVISERDFQISSIAMANQLVLVTHNVKEFGRIEELRLEAWAA